MAILGRGREGLFDGSGRCPRAGEDNTSGLINGCQRTDLAACSGASGCVYKLDVDIWASVLNLCEYVGLGRKIGQPMDPFQLAWPR